MKVGLYELLPLFIRMKDEEASGAGGTDPILKRIVGVIQDETDEMTALIAGIRDLISFDSTTDLILNVLARFLGVTEFPFSEIVTDKREYARGLADSHKIKGTVLSIIRERTARGLAADTYIHELWKWVINAVDEYVPEEIDAPYNSAYKSARVVFIDDPTGSGPPEDGPAPSDGTEFGIYVEDQIPYSTAKEWRRKLNNVFPIHVLVPPPVRRREFEDDVEAIDDDLGGQVYALFTDRYFVDSDALTILKECVSACQVTCQERCEVLCEFSCETTCETSCQALCESECQSTCQHFCEEACEQECQDSCQSFCQGNCQSLCQSACEINCQQACQYGCQDADEVCQSFCEMNCQTDRQILCDDTCQTLCQSNAQAPCPDGTLPAGEGDV